MFLPTTGVEESRNVAADVSSFTIDGLQADSAYRVFVSALIGSREGSPATLNIRTGIESDHDTLLLLREKLGCIKRCMSACNE